MPMHLALERYYCGTCRKIEWHVFIQPGLYHCLMCWGDGIITGHRLSLPEAPATTSLDTAFTSAR